MENLVSNQFHVFLTTLYGGLIIGFIYDLYRIFRYYCQPKKVATFIEDTIFWIIISITTLVLLFYSNWAQLRWYIFLGFIIGFFLYRKLLSDIIIKILNYIFGKIINLIKKIVYIVLYPIRIVIKLLSKPTNKIFNKGRRGYKKARRYFKIPGIITKDYKKQLKNLIKKK
ncbi:spore cortex biosynthesis protein YabQ [Clostridium sp. D2Q-11]|uniref:Spore cortex biosynthesis protein YabQ n=1 Tax=Anaeromonas frigoriresistens TaxID=2683708 RepID=A0A942UQU4_9FIRM|nr:spore cortex biosynthesis protein YabQ [Anaeromonas frigoriresistens]MBS4537584.1 spore cortex biosynthesis protein YabQ [Anaeromonas frigoriresistens]